MHPPFSVYPEERVALQSLAAEHRLLFYMEGEWSVWLIGEGFLIIVSVDIDGSEIDLYDVSNPSAILHRSGWYLSLLYRSDGDPDISSSLPIREHTQRYLQRNILLLKQYGQDILRGERGWLVGAGLYTFEARYKELVESQALRQAWLAAAVQ
jgi:hypothetical protein